MKALVWLVTLALSSMAIAQPMMIDPSKMSGIPRPDPQVPAGTITVRLIRGELSNRMPGVEVKLADEKGQVVTAKTDDQGRATFNGLAEGQRYQARASAGAEELTSQPIDLPSGMGVRVMLVFAAGGGATGEAMAGGPAADGVARPDKALPAGTVLVRAVGEGGTPLPGLSVILGHVRAGEQGVTQTRGTTDDKGEVKLAGNDVKPQSGYVVEVLKNDTRFASKPFRLQENMGSTVVVEARAVSRDLSALKIDTNSHFIFDIQDDVVQVIEVLHIVNSSSQAIDPPGGLHLTLPDKALQAGAGQGNPPTFSVNGHDALLRGPIPPGQTELQLAFLLAYDTGMIDFTQRLPIAWDQVSLVTEKIDGLEIAGNGLERHEREVQGRTLLLFVGPGVRAGEEVTLHVSGLPHANPLWRYVTAVAVALLLLGFGIYAAGGTRARDQLTALEGERERLLNELVALEQKHGSDKKRDARKEELTAKLAKVYRELDEVIR
jgi:hypothetical protein